MARAAPGVIRSGTAQELAALGTGYSASGVSEHSRHVSHGVRNIKGENYVPPKAPFWTRSDKQLLGEKIAEQATLLSALHMRLRSEASRERRAKITKDIEIKTKFLERLKIEQHEAMGNE